MSKVQNIILILGGGGLRGLAHIGVLKTLEWLGIPISEYAGTSVGAIVAGMAASGMKAAEIERKGLSIQPSDIFDIDYATLLTHPTRIKGLYKGSKLRQFIQDVIPRSRFQDLQKSLSVGAVDLGTGKLTLWGREAGVPLHDAIYASCAVPGLFPPQRVGKAFYIDGGSIESLALQLAEQRRPDAIIAVKLASLHPVNGTEIQAGGILSILERFYEIKNRQLAEECHRCFLPDIPFIWIEPDVGGHRFFKVQHLPELIHEGEARSLAVLASTTALGERGCRGAGIHTPDPALSPSGL